MTQFWPIGLEEQSVVSFLRKGFLLDKKWHLGNMPLFFGQMLLCLHVTLETVAAIREYDGLRIKPE